ncbi:KDO2-lipid IV(A) lauroyltransferase [Dyadobacter jejuensis]|uniref:KDO2-lipid IV(A) lauroyltransferase n=1 Tax=Dyadobacter jejuensis TaxID=1082580 RepID=A0A316B6X9_9BACT|nr:lysophospholipid acyltransferase family protein [Dyadobacter jejuensis]PWJ58317.1 KDO2-lipid IV(A) lauroyltransferase [Dyadobacter jejuensis]
MARLANKIILKTLQGIGKKSWKTIYRLSDFLSFTLNRLLGYRRKVVMKNLQNSLPNYSESQLKSVADQFYRNLSDIMLESLKLQSISKSELLERVSLDTSLFDKYYEQKKNLVVVLGHLGNWEIANLFAAVRLSHQVVVVYHQLANQTMDRWLYELRSRFGSEMIPMRQAMIQATAPREKPFLFFLVNDQSPNPNKAYWTQFLNQETGVFRGVENIARLLNAPVLYCAIMRKPKKRGYYDIKVEEITENPQELEQNAIIEKQIKLLERDIKTQPDNWLWSHKRWKHAKPRPLQTNETLDHNQQNEAS